MNPSTENFRPGDWIGDFMVRRELGRGSLTAVYLAREGSIGRGVALKVSRDSGGEGARTAAVLEHDHIVQVFSESVDRGRGMRLICMQYVPGTNLATVIAGLHGRARGTLTGQDILDIVDKGVQEPLALANASLASRRAFSGLSFPEAVASLGAKLAAALAFAHEKGFYHSDVKPANILIGPWGRPLLGDFNIADGATALARDGRADLFSLGSVLLELLDGERPVISERAAVGRPQLCSGAWDELRAILRRCVAPIVDEGLGSPKALVEKLEGYLESRALCRALPKPGVVLRFCFRHPLLGLITARAVPQIVGTIIATSYCYMRTGVRLTPEQKHGLLKMVRFYNSLSWPTGTLLACLLAFPVVHAWAKRRRDAIPDDPRRLAEWRRRARWLPFELAGVNTLTWFPSLGVFVVAANHLAGGFYLAGFLHFATAVVFSWFVATNYATMFAIYYVVRVLYPTLLFVRPGMREEAARELTFISGCVKSLPIFSGVIPLAAAFLLVTLGPGELTPDRYRSLQLLLVGLIAAGAAGLLLAVRVTEKINVTLRALSKN